MLRVVEFDFSNRKDNAIPFENISTDCPEGYYYWINVDGQGVDDFITILQKFCPDTEINSEFLMGDLRELLNIFHNSLHFTLFETFFIDDDFVTVPVHVILGKCFLATVYERNSRVVNKMLETYHDDFINFSQSPGFLLFEITDYISNMYQHTYREFDEKIDKLQLKLFEKVDDGIFIRVANSTQQLLDFRTALVSAREIITVLSTRKSPFISETTQPFLERKGNLLARLSDDLSNLRAIISDTLNLYMGYVSYKTNNLINRLTIVSLIFLPITFLVGVYGMNFAHMPELNWEYSYLVFWLLVIFILTGLLLFFKYKKWI